MRTTAICLLALACSGPIEDESEQELGQAQQGIVVRRFLGYNASNAEHRQPYRCDQVQGLETDVCNYPFDKSRKICVQGLHMTSTQKATAEADIDAFLPTLVSEFGMSGWTFSRSCASPYDVRIDYSNVVGSQTPTSILGYVTIIPGPSTTLSEPTPLHGAHQQSKGTDAATVYVDTQQIAADFATADRERVRRHAMYGGVYAAAVGLGFTSEHINRVTSIATTPATPKMVAVSNAEQCQVRNYDLGNPTEIILSPTNCQN